ncbi:MAG: DUF1579 domain-containing protein [Bacteroidota bacterium]
MKKLLTVVFMCLMFVSLQAQDQDAMQKWMESIQPGPMHQMMSKMVGKWKAVMVMVDPGSGQEMKSEGTATYEAILGGRYIKSSFSSTMMGMPFDGMGIDAYDNIAKEFVSIWIDNMGTGIMVMKGQYDEQTKTVNLSGDSIDPMSGQPMKYRSTAKWLDDNTTVFEMYSTMNGQEMKMFTMTYTRI